MQLTDTIAIPKNFSKLNHGLTIRPGPSYDLPAAHVRELTGSTATKAEAM